MKRVNPFVVFKVVDFELVLDSGLLFLEFFSLLLSGSWHPHQSPLLLFSRLVDVSVFASPVQVEQLYCLNHKVFLDKLIYWAVCLKARTLIHLNQPWLCLFVQENVHAKNLHAQLILHVLRLGSSLDVSDVVGPCNNSLDAYFFHLLPALLGRHDLWVCLSSLLDVLEDARETPLVAHVVIIQTLVLDEVFVFFVDCIVCQVHA